MRTLILLIIIFLSLTTSSRVAYATNEIGMSLTLTQMEPDFRGTDVRNIYTLGANVEDPNVTAGNTYDITMLIDGEWAENFDNQVIPFSVTRNFKAYVPGEHLISILVFDAKGSELANESISLTVINPTP